MQEAQIRLASIAKPTPLTEEIVVGKDVLELVAGAMYADPLTVYREYVQNAADAIDEARAEGAKFNDYEPQVLIHLDHVERTIRVRDLGAGVRNADFARRLTAVGASTKRGTERRGFRGVGRLSGLGYCQELIFRSRAKGDNKIKELRWDGRTLREKLRDASYTGTLADLIRAVAQVTTLTDDGTYPAHFFEVEMRKVLRIKNDLLLNEEEIRSYLAQVAPVPFDPKFKFGEQIRSWLTAKGVTEPIRIELNDDRGVIYHRAVDKVQLSKQVTISFSGVDFRELANSAGEELAFGWILQHGYVGAMPRSSKMGGIRLRMRDVQVGEANVLSPLFVEPRFSSWSVGEVHVAHSKIVPNGRRDEFEHSAAYAELQDELRGVVGEISSTIRSNSQQRQKSKRLALSLAYTENWIDIAQRRGLHETIRRAALEMAQDHANTVEKHIAKTGADPQSLATAERQRMQMKRLAESLEKKREGGKATPATTKSALAAVSAILSSSPRAQKAIPMAERVIAAMEGRLKEKA
jgi:hypothetical protein